MISFYSISGKSYFKRQRRIRDYRKHLRRSTLEQQLQRSLSQMFPGVLDTALSGFLSEHHVKQFNKRKANKGEGFLSRSNFYNQKQVVLELFKNDPTKIRVRYQIEIRRDRNTTRKIFNWHLEFPSSQLTGSSLSNSLGCLMSSSEFAYGCFILVENKYIF